MIRQFQQANEFQLTAPVASLFPLMRCSRSAVSSPLCCLPCGPCSDYFLQLHEAIFEDTQARCLRRVPECSPAQLTAMLTRLWPHTTKEDIKPIVLAVLNNHPSIPEAYLSQLFRVPRLLDLCSLKVKQQVHDLSYFVSLYQSTSHLSLQLGMGLH
jgi:hypothetical protein